MPKNAFFEGKKLQNRCSVWGSTPKPPLASRGWELCLQTPTSVFVHCEFFYLHLLTKAQVLSESTKRPYFLVSELECTQAFGVEKKLCWISYATVYIVTISFNFSFCLPPYWFCAGTTPDSAHLCSASLIASFVGRV